MFYPPLPRCAPPFSILEVHWRSSHGNNTFQKRASLTLACEYAISKIVDDEERVGNSLVGFCRWRLFKILRLSFGQDFEVEVQLRFWRWGLVKILKLIFDWSGSLVEILKLDLVKILKLRFSQYFDANVWSRFWTRNLIKICVRTWFTKFLNPRVRCAFGNVYCLWRCIAGNAKILAVSASQWKLMNFSS